MEIPRLLFEPIKDQGQQQVKYLVVLDQNGRLPIGQITYKNNLPVFYPYLVSEGWPGWILDDISQKINELDYYHHHE